MSLTPQQHQTFCQSFFNKIDNSDIYPKIRDILLKWQSNNKPSGGAIQAFLSMAQTIRDHDQQLIQYFNNCLVKSACVPYKISKEQSKQKPKLNKSNDQLFEPSNNIKSQSEKIQNIPDLTKTSDINDKQLNNRIQQNQCSSFITRVLHVYMRSIISLGQLKKLLLPVFATDPKLYHYLCIVADDIQTKRRKVTVFAPLNELVDQKYPMQQIGNSYVRIPDGYANYGKSWATNRQEEFLNRMYVSVPLGQENFIIGKKNDFQQLLFQNQTQKYEIDHVIQQIKLSIKHAQKPQRISSELLQRVLGKLYPNQKNIYDIVTRYPKVSHEIVVPRLKQKLSQVLKVKSKFEKNCKDIAQKNFDRSLDYRCFYFKKNDKKFNSQIRYEKEIKIRHEQLQAQFHNNSVKIKEDEQQTLEKSRNYLVNTFDNITKEQFQDRQIDISKFDRKINVLYPRFPQNQILFILNFENKEVLNDVLEILLYNSSRKNLFELMVLKMFGIQIQRKLMKDNAMLKILQLWGTKGLSLKQHNIDENIQMDTNKNKSSSSYSVEFINQKKQKKTYRDLTQEFHQLIDQEIHPAQIADVQSPFQGPDDHTMIGTKSCYFFIRYLLTLYQRFSKAKEISNDKLKYMPNVNDLQQLMDEEDFKMMPQTELTLYNLFLCSLIFKLKDQKLPDYMRILLKKDAFIFLTIDKLINYVNKIFTNINSDSLTYKILKENTKDFEMEIKKWDDYQFPKTITQLVRLSRQNQMLFRFSFDKIEGNVYVSAWQNYPDTNENNTNSEQINIAKYSNNDTNIIESFVYELNIKTVSGLGSQLKIHPPKQIEKVKKHSKNKQTEKNEIPTFFNNNSEYFINPEKNCLNMIGEEILVRTKPVKRSSQYSLKTLQRQFNRIRKLRNGQFVKEPQKAQQKNQKSQKEVNKTTPKQQSGKKQKNK